MSRSSGTILFIVLFVIVFIGSLVLVTNGTMGRFSIGFIPIIFFSELITFSMVYLATYYDGHEEEEVMEIQAKSHVKH